VWLLRRVLAAGFIISLVALAAIWFIFRTPGPTAFAGGSQVDLAAYSGKDPTGAPSALAGADPVKRGEYLMRTADCAACHTAPGGQPLAGGLAFKLPFGTLYSPNITADQETGIGAWSDEDFVSALQEGIGRGGQHLYPVFPYASYTLMTRADALAIKAYLFSLKPIHSVPPVNEISFPFNQHYLISFWNMLFNPGERFRPNADRPPEWNRGAYLVEALGHCGDCHTPRNVMQAVDQHRKFAGAMVDGWKAYNITTDPLWGIGAWSNDQLADYLANGHAAHRSSAAGPMADAIENSLRFLSRDDVQAMAVYLKSIPPIADGTDGASAPTPAAELKALPPVGSEQSLGLHVFEGGCVGCHRFDGSGAAVVYADFLGSRTVNDGTGVNATQAVLQGARLHTAQGEVYMPPFGPGYSNAEIAAEQVHEGVSYSCFKPLLGCSICVVV
jgi:mono/diheme cytochrome c family protein